MSFYIPGVAKGMSRKEFFSFCFLVLLRVFESFAAGQSFGRGTGSGPAGASPGQEPLGVTTTPPPPLTPVWVCLNEFISYWR